MLLTTLLFLSLLMLVQGVQSPSVSVYSAAIVSAVVSPDSTFFVTGAENKVKIWNYSTKTLITTLTYNDAITNININPLNNMIFINVKDGIVSFIDPATFTQTADYAYSDNGYSNSL
jgi:WD40 repeat protein